LKLKCDKLLSSFAFNFKLRRHNEVAQIREQLRRRLAESGFDPSAPAASANADNDDFVRCVLAAGLFPNVARAGSFTRSLLSST
jgi:hypothetical protein